MSRAPSWVYLLTLLGAWIACASATAVVERRSVCNSNHHQGRPSHSAAVVQKKWGRPGGDKWSRGGGSGPSRLDWDGAGSQETGAPRGGNWGGWQHRHAQGDSASSGQLSSQSQVINRTPDQHQESEVNYTTQYEDTQQETTASRTEQESEASKPTSTSEETTQPSNTGSASADSSSRPGLARHNTFRAQYDARDLTWNTDLASGSAQWASQQCSGLHHAQSGENIAIGYASANNSIDGWMDEASQFDFSNPGYSDATGHFTQVIWKSTTEVGCGSYDCGDQVAWVCRYSPAGNVLGDFVNNIGSKV